MQQWYVAHPALGYEDWARNAGRPRNLQEAKKVVEERVCGRGCE